MNKRFTIYGDLLVSFSIEIEAANEEAASQEFAKMALRDLWPFACTDPSTMAINESSVSSEEE